MNSVFIVSHSTDTDSLYVSRSIQAKQGHVTKWHTDQLSLAQTVNLKIGANGFELSLTDLATQSTLLNADSQHSTVWLRAMQLPVLPEHTHPDDRDFLNKENRVFIEYFIRSLLPDAFWVNTWAAGRSADNKIAQLLHAAQIGLAIPETCISNDRETVLEFVSQNRPALYKAFNFHHWKLENGGEKRAYAQLISPDKLPSAALMRANPGIFQQFIRKVADVRTVCMGHSHFSLKLTGQGNIDWRRDSVAGQLQAEPYQLPKPIHDLCLKMMRHFGIAIAAFDFALDAEGRLVFLELNEAGQFLWMEETCADLPILDAFSEFLLAGRNDFVYAANTPRIHLADLKATRQREVTASAEPA